MSNITFSDPIVERAIFYHKFVALVEVTNGIIDPRRRQDRRRQIKVGKELIQARFGDDVQVVGGLALIKNTEKPIKELDFHVNIPQYNLRVLYNVLEEILSCPYLTEEQKARVESMSETSMGLAHNLTAPINKRKQTSRAQITPESEDALAKIKGVVLEYYVKELLEEVIDPTFGLVTSLRTTIQRPGNQNYTQSTPDLLFACPPAIFYEGLERLANRYFGRQKISVIVKDNKE